MHGENSKKKEKRTGIKTDCLWSIPTGRKWINSVDDATDQI